MATSAVMADTEKLPSLSPVKLYQLDGDASLVSRMPVDRVVKYLLRPGKGIKQEILLEGISRTIESGGADRAISADLALGDDRLREAMMSLLAEFNISPMGATAMINAWARGKDEDLVGLKSILGEASRRKGALSHLGDYLVKNDARWLRTLRALHGLLDGKDKDVSRSIAVAVSNATGTPLASVNSVVAKAQAGDMQSRWLLASNLQKVIDAHGSMDQVMEKSQLDGQTFYEKAWMGVMDIIAENGELSMGYMHSGALATPLYDGMAALASAALQEQTDAVVELGENIRHASLSQPRMKWIVDQCIPGTDDERADSDERGASTIKMMGEIGTLVGRDEGWSDLMLWHLTRIGEAAVASTRTALPQAVGQEDELALRLLKDPSPLGEDFEHLLNKTTAYSYYSGGKEELLKKIETGSVEKPALEQYLGEVTRLLSSNDQAWAAAWEDKNAWFLKEVMAITIERSAQAATAWLQTAEKNDPALRAGYLDWMVHEGGARDLPTATLWLKSVTGAIDGGNVTGNEDVAKAKYEFIRFLKKDPGWGLVCSRIEMESFGVPNKLRTLMVASSARHPELFWPVYRMLLASGGDLTTMLKRNIGEYIENSDLPGLLLDEIAFQNPYAGDAASSVWDSMMSKTGKLQGKMKDMLVSAMTKNTAYGPASMALLDVLDSNDGWGGASGYAAAFYGVSPDDAGLKQRTISDIATSATTMTPLLQKIMGDKALESMWRERCLVLMKFFGRSASVASMVRSDDELKKEWASSVARVASNDGMFMEAVLRAMYMRRVGDQEFGARVENVRADLARLIFYDRILFEQIISDKNADFRKAFLGKVGDIFDMYIREKVTMSL